MRTVLLLAAVSSLALVAAARRRRGFLPWLYWRRRPLFILDGGCGLELKRRKALGQAVAYDLTLFSTASLRETPEAILELHRDYIRAGCTVLTTATFAVTRFYLDKVGEGHRVEELARRAVSLARSARAQENAEDRVLIAASVPPLGESYQATRLSEADARMQYGELLSGLAGCDVFLCETMATLAEARLAAELCRTLYPNARVWLSFTPRRTEAGDGVCIAADGATVADAVEAAAAAGCELVSFNCATPELITVALTEAKAVASGLGLRIGGYANFWEEHDLRGWSIDMNESGSGTCDQKQGGMTVRNDLSHDVYAEWAAAWRCRCGADLIGGCCGIGPKTMTAVCERVRQS